MQVFSVKSEKDLLEFNKSTRILERGCTAALGFFDGVHAAHRTLISEAVKTAKKSDIPSLVLTFSAKNTTFKPDRTRLFTDGEKLSEISSLGVDITVVFDFEIIKDLSKDEFVDKILVGMLNVKTAFCGYNFRFGKSAAGNSEYLENKMRSLGRDTVVLDEYVNGGVSVSSTEVRALLSEKRLSEATALLGKPFFSDGKVSHGWGLGKKLGIPTVNVDWDGEKFVLPHGVYLSLIEISGRLYCGITNVGTCPTFDERKVHSETFIFDFDEEVYDENIRIYYVDFMRDEIKFPSQKELIMQINIDINRAKELSKEIKWQGIGLSSR